LFFEENIPGFFLKNLNFFLIEERKKERKKDMNILDDGWG